MSFLSNLKEKITIDTLTKRVKNSLSPPGTPQHLDREAVLSLLSKGDFTKKEERDLVMYVFRTENGENRILVLDNDLSVYRTTMEDVVLRKSPTVKEMISFRNIRKILNDTDVVVSKKEETIDTIYNILLSGLNLTYDAADMEKLEYNGKVALDTADTDGVREALLLFSEILDMDAPPPAFTIGGLVIYGKISKGREEETLFGPVVSYSRVDNRLKYMAPVFSDKDPGAMETYRETAAGEKKPDIEGTAVFARLKEKAMEKTEKKV